jgi:hypothetical protein
MADEGLLDLSKIDAVFGVARTPARILLEDVPATMIIGEAVFLVKVSGDARASPSGMRLVLDCEVQDQVALASVRGKSVGEVIEVQPGTRRITFDE